MRKLFFILVVFISLDSFSQIQGDGEIYLSGDLIDPVFEGGGLDKFYDFVNKNFNFTKVTKKELWLQDLQLLKLAK